MVSEGYNSETGVPEEFDRYQNLADARKYLSQASATVVDVPELRDRIAPVHAALERADALDVKAEDARSVVPVRERERDNAERVAFREGKDPVATTKAAQDAVTVAKDTADTADRLADTAAREVRSMASRLRSQARKAAVDAAPRTVRAKLRQLDSARAEARAAVENAARAMNRVSGLAANIHAVSGNLPESDPLHRISRSRQFSPREKPTSNSNRPTVETVIMEMRDVANMRFSYGNGGLHKYQTLGVEMGNAVKRVAEEDAAANDG